MEIRGLRYTKRPGRSFASDNNSGVHPAILKALLRANTGHALAYGFDAYTEAAVKQFKKAFGRDTDVFFAFTGTAANVLGIRAVTESYHSIICAAPSHLNYAECGAMENFGGNKLLLIPTKTGKITVPEIEEQFKIGRGDQHHCQAKVVSIVQSTDMGAIYSLSEVKAIAAYCHKNNMYLHMDGARLANACAALKVSLKALTTSAGVDVLSFGGTKNGLLMGEAVVFLKPGLGRDFKYVRKQGMQLYSKMRFIAAQYEALLSGGLCLKNAKHSNRMGKLMASELKKLPAIKITRPVEANMVYCTMPANIIPGMWKKYLFYIYDAMPASQKTAGVTSSDEFGMNKLKTSFRRNSANKLGDFHDKVNEVRLVMNYDTTEGDVRGFIALLRKQLS